MNRNLLLVAAFTAQQVLSRRKTAVLLLLSCVPAAFGLIIRYFAAGANADPFYWAAPLVYTAFLCQVLPLFFAGSLIRDAVEDRTAAFVLTTPVGRSTFVFGTLLGLIPPLVLLTVGSVVLTFAAWRHGVEAWWSDPEPRALLLNLVGVASVGTCLYAALFTLLGLVVKWPTVVGVAYYGLFELFLGFTPGPAQNLPLSTSLEALLRPPFRRRVEFVAEEARLPAQLLRSPSEGALTLLIATAVICLALVWRARNRDFAEESAAAR
ncbi:MAG TPA: hypothetical protein VEI02_16990 [Planctomycetota bacterium]|nr:hypothetical protein [Planctomycetota bacterium]